MDNETQLPTYLLLIKNQLILATYVICSGLEPDTAADLLNTSPDIQLLCIERGGEGSHDDAAFAFQIRSRDCRLVYPANSGADAHDGLFQCDACRTLLPQVVITSSAAPRAKDTVQSNKQKKTIGAKATRRQKRRRGQRAQRETTATPGCDDVLRTEGGDDLRWTVDEEVKCEPALNDDNDGDWMADGCDDDNDAKVTRTGAEDQQGQAAVKVKGRRRGKRRKLAVESDGKVGKETPEEEVGGDSVVASRKRTRTSLASFCERLRGEPRCETCGVGFPAMIDYARHMKREHPNSHRQEVKKSRCRISQSSF